YVRGGGPDQNLYLLDGVPVYNPSHVLGFMSVFNNDALKSVKLYKGGFPARYGGRLSSVVDIQMKDGNMNEIKGNFSIGLISSKLQLEGPIIKNKTSFMLSVRRTYLDVFLVPYDFFRNMNVAEKKNTSIFFHDFNLKVNHIFNEKSRLYLSAYNGKDQLKLTNEWQNNNFISKDQTALGWGNAIASLRWNYLINNKLFCNTTLTYTNFHFETDIFYKQTKNDSDWKYEEIFQYHSGIKDYTAKVDFDYLPNPKNTIKFGSAYVHHYFSPGVTRIKNANPEYSLTDIDTLIMGNRSIVARELATYFEDEITISKQLKINTGIHVSLFNVDGQNFWRLQPRFSARYKISGNTSVKASYSRMAQHLHLLTTSGINFPTDLWVPITKNFAPPISDQFAVGGVHSMHNGITVTIEGFYKSMQNLIDYREGATFMQKGTEWENKVELGKGWSYGAEFLLEKTIGKSTGWIGYTWSKSERQFPNINFDKEFPAKYDRRHDVSISFTHQFNDKLDIGSTWVYGTGNAVTMALSSYKAAPIPGVAYNNDILWPIQNYKSKNNYRMPSYHRLDVGANFHKKKKHGTRTWSLSLYNAYSRLNPFMITWETSGSSFVLEDENGNPIAYRRTGGRLKQISLFPIIPSVSYSFKF
ncbi:MAG: TonB-dependent receptor plug domain-containing protein, partial [Marinilabiliaceae bacterium]|nr:TonB-dependent receptor plug domain-containing protein [Marinilabiliaceae bacterium]